MSAPLKDLATGRVTLSDVQSAHTDALNALAEAKCALEHKRAA